MMSSGTELDEQCMVIMNIVWWMNLLTHDAFYSSIFQVALFPFLSLLPSSRKPDDEGKTL
jgi:hypothetical protein